MDTIRFHELKKRYQVSGIKHKKITTSDIKHLYMKLSKTLLKQTRKWILIVSIPVSTLLSFSFVDSYFELSKNLDIFATLLRELNTYYVDDIKPGDLVKKGIDESSK